LFDSRRRKLAPEVLDPGGDVHGFYVKQAKAGLVGPVEKAFGPKMDTLMRMQNSFDIARTRKREKKITVRRYQPEHAQH
jgi:hypothetical protein